jgi:TRAP-type mannitol/chloroaromatic compound transport system permease large subunit
VDNLVLGWIGLGVLFAMLAIGLPVGIALGLVGFVGYGLISGFPAALVQMQNVPFSSVSSYTLTVIPLFIVMGEFAFHSGLIRSAYNTAHKWFGHLPGGLAITTVAGCAAFASICGSGIATASTMTSLAYPEMKRHNYDSKLSLGAVACGGTLGILIPPSNPMVIYAVFSDVSVGKLFMSGFIPGILMTLLFVATILIWTNEPSAGPVVPGVLEGPVVQSRVSGGGNLVVIAWAFRDITPWKRRRGAFDTGYRNTKNKGQNTAQLFTALRPSLIFLMLIGHDFNYFIVLSGLPNQLQPS